MKKLLIYFSLLAGCLTLISCGATDSTTNYQVSISASPTEGGTVSPSGGEYEEGQSLEISANPSEGWRFVEWAGDYSGQSSMATVTVDKDMNIKAEFEKKEYPLTVNTYGEGTVDEEVIQTNSTDYEHGTVVELTANPADGWEFVEWQGEIKSSENPKHITVDEPRVVGAVFSRVKVSLDVSVKGKGEVKIEPDHEKYNANTKIKITANAKSGWKFTEWSGDTSATVNPLELTLNDSKELEVLFDEQKVIYVNAKGSGINNGDSWGNAYRSLQPALAEAQNGDEIWVSEGTYFPDRSDKYTSFKLKNNVKVLGGFSGNEDSKDQRDWSLNVTTLSGEIGDDGKGDNITTLVEAKNLDTGTVLDGFTVTGGNTNRSNGAGIDVSNSNLEISNLIISNNKAIEGGGVFASESELLMKNIEFNNNSVGNGGGIYSTNSNSTIIDSKFTDNRVNRRGGAIFNRSGDLKIINTEFENNYSSRGGGAIYNEDGKNTIVENSLFRNNKSFATGGGAILNDNISGLTIKNTIFLSDSTSGDGGALRNYLVDDAQIINSAFAGNYSLSDGGAIYNKFCDNILIVNGVFSHNSSTEDGGAIYDERNKINIINGTFSANTADDSGGGIYFAGSESNIYNSIFWNNFSDYGSQLYGGGAQVYISHSILMDGVPDHGENYIILDGNSAANPLFIDEKGDDNIYGTRDDNLRLQSNSPAIDVGFNDVLDLDGDGDNTDDIPVNLGGNTRIQNGTVDIGAYESDGN